MKVDLLYGRGTLALTIEDAWDATVIRKRQMPLVEDPALAIIPEGPYVVPFHQPADPQTEDHI
jgi:hypothetical protein